KELDTRRARLAYELNRFWDAVDLYDRHPDDLVLRVSKGWALLSAGWVNASKAEFLGILATRPHNRDALAGYRWAQEAGPLSLLLVQTYLDFDRAHSKRQLRSAYLRYLFARTFTTLVYTRTDSVDLGAGDVDFSENMLGLKLFYRFDERHSMDVHGLSFRNNDRATDGGVAAGVRYWYQPDRRWSLGAGCGGTNYPLASTSQVTIDGGCQVWPDWRVDLMGLFVKQSIGRQRSISKGTTALKGTVTCTPNRRFLLSLSGWAGERQLAYDSQDMYALNLLDIFGTGWSVLATYRLAHPAKVLAKYGENVYTPYVVAGSTVRPGPTEQTEKVMSVGLDYSF
ncbi:MAG: hypothetical protein HY815_32950, partial [Candidatus Riflebacteria bacterium]|nr:hypothetical protein [Candidatus Riflebacteria bacterium]